MLNKLFNIVHAFSICVLCLFKLINFIQSKNTLFSLKGLKRAKECRVPAGGLGLCAIEWHLRGGDRRQTTNGAFDQNITAQN